MCQTESQERAQCALRDGTTIKRRAAMWRASLNLKNTTPTGWAFMSEALTLHVLSTNKNRCPLWVKSRHRLAWNFRQSRECGTVVSKHSRQLHATRMRHGRPGGIGSRCWRLRQRLFAGSIALHPRGCGQSMGEPRTNGRGSFIWRLPTKADMCGATSDVCYGPIANSCTAAKRSPARSSRSN